MKLEDVRELIATCQKRDMPVDFKSLREAHGRIVDAMSELLGQAKKETRDLTQDETTAHADLGDLATRFADMIRAADHEREQYRNWVTQHAPGTPASQDAGPVFALDNGQEVRALLPGESLADRYPMEDRNARFGRFVRALITGDWTGAEAERRAAGEGVGSLGGVFVPTPISARVIDLARNKSILVRGGAMTIPMTSGEMTIVRQLTDVTGEWRAEHSEVTESEPTFEPVKLKAITLAAITRVSIELMEDAPAFGQLIETAIGAALGLELDRAGIFGTGTGEPRGIVNTPGVNEVSLGANGAALTNHDPWLDAIEKIENANGVARTTAYAPRTKRALAGLKNTQNDLMRAPQDFADLTRLTSNQFPINETKGTATNASTALVGDFAQAGIALRTGLNLEATRWGDKKAFSQLEVLIRGYLRADVAVLRPAHFTKITGIKP